MDWAFVNVGVWIITKAYQVVDPVQFPRVWNDRWLQRYATALIKKQWGQNLTKFTGMQLPGGVQFNGEKIYNDAATEIETLEQEMKTSWSLPATDMIG
jgi:hypothetical protein